VQNENALKDADRALHAGDKQKIAHQLQAIDRCNTISLVSSTKPNNRNFSSADASL
jgi:hypothetical protein